MRFIIIAMMAVALAFTGLAGVPAANASTTAAPTSAPLTQSTALDRDDDRKKSRYDRDRDRDGKKHHKKRCVKKRIVIWRSHRDNHRKFNDHRRVRVVIVKKYCFRH